MGRMYTAIFQDIAVTVATDLFEVVAPATGAVYVHGLILGQTTDVGDAAEEIMSIFIRSGQTTSGSGGAAVTPVPIRLGDTAFGGTVERNNTTKATAGTIVTRHVDTWNVRSQYLWIPTPEMRLRIAPSARLTVEMPAPTDSLTMSGTIYLESV